jgi:hypothetical protein
MRTVSLPTYDSAYHPPLELVAKAILDEDQFDDWLADPIYWLDRESDGTALARLALDAFRQGSVTDFPIGQINVPRRSGKAIPTVTLPMLSRICAHSLIGATLTRIAGKLTRDKVYGFRYQDGQVPLFIPPVNELKLALAQINEVIEYASNLIVIDIADFTTATRFERLQGILDGMGGARPELKAISELAVMPNRGMPSGGPAFRALYNYYLEPVDRLLASGSNFVRFGDEYYLFDEAAVNSAMKGIQSLQLSGVVKARLTRSELIDRGPSSVLTVEGIGSIRAELIDIFRGNTDYYELRLSLGEGSTTGLKLLPEAASDGVDMVPILRWVHRVRKDAVLDIPPYDSASAPFRAYRRELQSYRSVLRDIGESCLQRGSGWALIWASQMLTDLGSLDPECTDVLLRATVDQNIEKQGRLAAITALARAGPIEEAIQRIRGILEAPDELTGEFDQRIMLLAGYYAAARNQPHLWDEVKLVVGQHHPAFVTKVATQANRRAN